MKRGHGWTERLLATLGIPALGLLALLAGCNGDAAGPERVAEVTITASGNKTQLLVGEQVQLTATALDRHGAPLSGRSFSFASSNGAVAIVDPVTGLVTAVGAGTVRISAHVEGVSGFVDLGISVVPVATVRVTPGALALHLQWTEPLTVVLEDASGSTLVGRTISYTSSDENIARVSASGVVSGWGIGDAAITVTSEGKSATVAVTVSQAPVHGIEILPGSANIPDGLEIQFSVALTDARGFNLSRPITWSSSSEAVATVSGTGRAFGVAPGEATVTASVEGKSASVPLIVRARVATIVVSPPAATMRRNEELQLGVTLLDRNGTVLTGRAISFSPFAGVAVTTEGLVRALETGEGNIIVRSEGREALVPLRVIEPVMFVDVTPLIATVPVGSQTQLIVTLRDRAGHVLTDRAIDFSSANTNVASVSPTGLVTGVTGGTTMITVLSEGVSRMVQITVP